MTPQNWTLSCFKKKSTLLTESKINMNITKIIFSALHLYAINQNYMQCLGLGNRAEASLFYVAKGNLRVRVRYRRELQH